MERICRTKKGALKRLELTMLMLSDLKPGQFNYNEWVSKADFKHNCGTTCCVAGWYPAWFPESGLIWESNQSAYYFNLVLKAPNIEIGRYLAEYHGLTLKVTSALFKGHPLLLNGKLLLPPVEDAYYTTINEVMERFQIIYEALLEGKNSLLKLDY